MSKRKVNLLVISIILITLTLVTFYFLSEKYNIDDNKVYVDRSNDILSDEDFCSKGKGENDEYIKFVFGDQIAFEFIGCDRWNNSKMGFEYKMSESGSEAMYELLKNRLKNSKYKIFRAASVNGSFAADSVGDDYNITFYGKYGSDIVTIELSRK